MSSSSNCVYAHSTYLQSRLLRQAIYHSEKRKSPSATSRTMQGVRTPWYIYCRKMQIAIFILLISVVPNWTAASTGDPETCRTLNSVSRMSSEEVKAELAHYMREYGFVRPHRSKIDPSLNWRNGPPSYDVADLLYFRGKTMNHTAGSLESIVENLVKKWEMEATHLLYKDWTVVEHDVYKISANGGKKI